jgi:hypothetical protein
LFDDFPGSTVLLMNVNHKINNMSDVSIKTCKGASLNKFVHLYAKYVLRSINNYDLFLRTNIHNTAEHEPINPKLFLR